MDKIGNHANSYASANGLLISSGEKFECAPISLFPNAYPRSAFGCAQNLAPPFNKLVDRISRDEVFLKRTLGGAVSEADPFTAKLLELYEKVYCSSDSNFAHSADRLGIHRSDYMLHSSSGDYELKQVELNTIASSFAGLAVNVAALHRHLVTRFQDDLRTVLETNKRAVIGEHATWNDEDGVPDNPALTCLPRAFSVAYNRYQDRYSPATTPIILFVVQEGETNTVDQRLLEFSLWEKHGIAVERMSLTAANSQLGVDDETGALYIKDTRKEVAIVYFRAGYAPTDYPDGYDGVEWQAREMMERSRATKSPCLGYHLAGTKKVQQELARPGVLERFFLDEPTVVEPVRGAFAGLYSLGEDATDADLKAIKSCLSGSEGQYVLKPQREGGGYNFYGKQLAEKLRDNIEETSSGELVLGKELAEFILMQRLFPPKQQATLLRSGKVEGTGDSISELGCFGAIVASGESGEVVHNEYAGFLLRTKFANVDEGGVASGFATLSSPFLC